MGLRRGMQRTAKQTAGRVPLHSTLPAGDAQPSRSDAFAVAVKALVYGTALCGAGAGAVCLGVSSVMGVHSVRVQHRTLLLRRPLFCK